MYIWMKYFTLGFVVVHSEFYVCVCVCAVVTQLQVISVMNWGQTWKSTGCHLWATLCSLVTVCVWEHETCIRTERGRKRQRDRERWVAFCVLILSQRDCTQIVSQAKSSHIWSLAIKLNSINFDLLILTAYCTSYTYIRCCIVLSKEWTYWETFKLSFMMRVRYCTYIFLFNIKLSTELETAGVLSYRQWQVSNGTSVCFPLTATVKTLCSYHYSLIVVRYSLTTYLQLHIITVS